jgi:acyl-CoA thioesterase I
MKKTFYCRSGEYQNPVKIIIYWMLVFTSMTILIALAACDDSTKQITQLPDDAVILAFGDSLTHGTGAEKNESYPVILEQSINRKVINAGIPGELSIHGLKRLPQLLEQHQPELLILCHGGNDLLQKKNLAETETNIRQMIALAVNKDIPVILLGVPKPGLFLNDAKLYSNISESTDITYIPNLIAEILSDASMKSDPVHPNEAGYKKMALALASALRDSGAL